MNKNNFISLNRLSIFFNGEQYNKTNPFPSFFQTLNRLEQLNLIKLLNEQKMIWIHPLIHKLLSDYFSSSLEYYEVFIKNFENFYLDLDNLPLQLKFRSVDEILLDFSFANQINGKDIDVKIDQLYLCLSTGVPGLDYDKESNFYFQQLRNFAAHRDFFELVSFFDSYIEKNQMFIFKENLTTKNLYSPIIWKFKTNVFDIKPLSCRRLFLLIDNNGTLQLGDIKKKEISRILSNDKLV